MNEPEIYDSLERTTAACAWPIDIAKQSVELYELDPVTVRYLEHLE